WDGAALTQVPSGTQAVLFSLAVPAPGDVWAGAIDGNLLHRSGSGAFAPMPSGVPHPITGLWASAPGELWGVTIGGYWIRVHAGKATAMPVTPLVGLHAIWGSGPTDLWAVGEAGYT